MVRRSKPVRLQQPEELGLSLDGGLDQLTDSVIGSVVEAVRPHRFDGHGQSWRLLSSQDDQIQNWLDSGLTAVKVGELLSNDTRRRHAGTDVLAFFRWIDLHVDSHLDIHVVLDNLSAHKSEPVRQWLASPKRARWHLHFTPTSASWLNLIEGWFSVLTRKALTNTSFASVAEVETAIDLWAPHWNDHPHPFLWTKNRQRHHRQSSTWTGHS